MRTLTKIDINKSIEQEKLIFKEDFSDKLNRVSILFIFGLISYFLLTQILKTNLKDINEIIISTLNLILIVFFTYILFRNLTEYKLFKVETTFNRKEIRNIILDYSKEKSFEIYRNSDDCIIINKITGNKKSDFRRSGIFIIKNNLLLFTIIRDQQRINFPILFSHILLKCDLIKLLKRQAF